MRHSLIDECLIAVLLGAAERHALHLTMFSDAHMVKVLSLCLDKLCCCVQVHDLVMAAILAAEPELHSAARMHVPHRTNCFEVCTSSQYPC